MTLPRLLSQLPEIPESEPGFSLGQNLLYAAVYGVIIVAIVAYLLWKLPRGGDGSD